MKYRGYKIEPDKTGLYPNKYEFTMSDLDIFGRGALVECRVLIDEILHDLSQHYYCFKCEIEMPVKKVGASLHCAQCGLRHGLY